MESRRNIMRNLSAGEIRMRDHLKTITGRYVCICQELMKTGNPVEEDNDLDRLMRTGEFVGIPIEPNYEYLKLQIENINYAIKPFANHLHERGEKLKKAALFDLELSMHTG